MSIALQANLSRLLSTVAALATVANPGNNTDLTGAAYVLTRSNTDADEEQDVFALFCDYAASAGGGSTQMEGYLLTSFDGGTTWFQAAALPTIQSGEHRSELVPVNGLGPLVAFVTKLTGTPKPTQILTAKLCCSGGFKLTAAASSVVVNTTFATPLTSPVNATVAKLTESLNNLRWKAPVRAATTQAIPAYTRTGNVITANAVGALVNIDGVTLVAGDRLLFNDGVAGADNGIYVVTRVGDAGLTFVLTRADDCNSDADLVSGVRVAVTEGTSLGGSVNYLATANPISLNTTAQTWTPFATIPDPSNKADNVAAPKSYTDTLGPKRAVRVATTGALPAYTRVNNIITANANGALPAIDGVALIVGDRMLLLNGAAGQDNGIYVVTQVGDGGTPYVLTRAHDANTSAKMTTGIEVLVTAGTILIGQRFRLITAAPITLNTTALSFTSALVTATPTLPGQAANKSYVDYGAAKPSVKLATVAQPAAYTRVGNVITANGNGALGNIDGVATAQGDRIALLNGAAGQDNGIYVVTQLGDGGTPFILTRAVDFDSDAAVVNGAFFYVRQGNTYADTILALTTDAVITLNTTVLAFGVRGESKGNQGTKGTLAASSVMTGTVAFANNQDNAVNFGTAFADANYRVFLTPDAAHTEAFFADTLVAGGFHAKTGVNFTGNVNWLAIHN